MKVLSASQIRQLDACTIEKEPIASIDLMERASKVFTDWFVQKFPEEGALVCIFCGSGNNGGDGFAVARLLSQRFYKIYLYDCRIGSKRSPDCELNFERLPKRSGIEYFELKKEDPFPTLPSNAILIDAIFGSGLNRPVAGYWGDLLLHLNQQDTLRIAIDIPSGLFADQHSEGPCFEAAHTFSFELPKLAFFFPENHHKVGHWAFSSIGLNQQFIAEANTQYHYLNHQFTHSLIEARATFGHKGTYGHSLLIAGSYGKVGAAMLAAQACLRAGAGLLSVHSPSCAYPILQTGVPEAMVHSDLHQQYISELPDLAPYRAIGCGCGIDTQATTAKAIKELLTSAQCPLVLDADALNIIAANREWLQLIPKGSILTPHPGEFRRLFGEFDNDFARNQFQLETAQSLGLVIILKGAYTAIATPEGQCYFNSSGNPGMATAGSGDVLTGILTALLSQNYNPTTAALLGVYLHGLCGDLFAQIYSQEGLIARDLISNLPKAWKVLHSPYKER